MLRIRHLLLVFLVFGVYKPSVSLACKQKATTSSRVAIAGGSITEIFYLLGEQKRIVATDRTSNYPEEAKQFPSVGYVRNLSAEGLVALKPNLIIGDHDMGPPKVLDLVRRTGINIITIPKNFSSEGVVSKIRCIAKILDIQDKAETIIDKEITPAALALKTLLRSSPSASQPRVAVLLGIRGGVFLAAGLQTSGDGLLKMAGAKNVMNAFNNWKPVSTEAMLKANPDYIIIPKRGVESAGGMAQLKEHPSLRLINATKNNRIITYDGMSMLGFGPRTIEVAYSLAKALRKKGAGSHDTVR